MIHDIRTQERVALLQMFYKEGRRGWRGEVKGPILSREPL